MTILYYFKSRAFSKAADDTKAIAWSDPELENAWKQSSVVTNIPIVEPVKRKKKRKRNRKKKRIERINPELIVQSAISLEPKKPEPIAIEDILVLAPIIEPPAVPTNEEIAREALAIKMQALKPKFIVPKPSLSYSELVQKKAKALSLNPLEAIIAEAESADTEEEEILAYSKLLN